MDDATSVLAPGHDPVIDIADTSVAKGELGHAVRRSAISRRTGGMTPAPGPRESTAPFDAALAEELSLLIDGATTYAIYMLDPHGRITIWNRGAERIKGWAEADVIGRDCTMFYTAEDQAAGKPAVDLRRASELGRVEEESWRLRKDGSEFLANVTITALRDETGALRGFGKVIRDITDQKSAEFAVLRRERHLRSILATVPDAMIVMDEAGTISSFSKAAELAFGYAQQDMVGRSVGVLIPGVFARGGEGARHSGLTPGVSHLVGRVQPETGLRRNGKSFAIELAVGEASIAGERIFTGFVRDMTERREAERRMQELQSELVHVSRLSAMGTMASTLAHEINQPLTAIANYLEAARAMIDGRADELLGEVTDALDRATAQSHRAGAIVRRLRAFVAGGDTGFRVERLDTLVEEATSLGLLGAHEAGITVTMTIAAGRDRVMVDRVQIQQVLVNLIRNAIQSMASSGRKELTIATGRDRDGWMKITVADTGSGIDPAIRDHLFDAFATTKEDGMGLGLSICRTIAEAHGGRIWAEAVPDGGTAFHFCVPLAAEGASDER